jgi:hypothetical protein
LLLIGILDQAIGRILKKYYFKQESGLYYRTTYAIDSTKADIVIFGSSRANHHYVPEVFEDNLNLSFYNCGREGNFLLFNYGVFKAIIKRYNPKIIIFDINYNDLYYNRGEYERLFSLMPYYKDHPEIRNIIDLKSPYEKYKLVSEIYPFNSSLLTIVIGNMGKNKTRKNDRQGYVPLVGKLNDTVVHKIEPNKGIIDSNKVNSINDIVNYCSKNNICLIFVQSPIYAKVENTVSNEFFEQSDKKGRELYISFSNLPEFFAHPEYFKDQDHLNDQGATYFSKILVNRISKLLEERKTQN